MVKFGVSVKKDEATNQQAAYNLINHRIIRVPRVYRFFNDSNGLGYLVMEYVAGRVIDSG